MESSSADTELPNKMALLNIMEMDEANGEVSEVKPQVQELNSRVLRKRKPLTPEKTKPSNLRVSMKPRKHMKSEIAFPKKIEALYLNKKFKCVSEALETIYEEPKGPNSNTEVSHIGGRLVKRQLIYQVGNNTKEKIEMRRAQMKKLQGSKTFLNRKKIPMHVFLKTIECLELDEVVQTTTTPT